MAKTLDCTGGCRFNQEHSAMSDDSSQRLNVQNILACIWDFDRTLIHGNMQEPIFEEYGIDSTLFWKEVNTLPQRYAARGQAVSKDTVYLNHLITYVRHGRMKGLNNAKLRELGRRLTFYPGMPDFLSKLKQVVRSKPEYVRSDIRLEHYIISTGLAEMIRGSAVAKHVDGIYGCEFIENPLPPGYLSQEEFSIEDEPLEIAQVGTMVDNTIKTRFIFEINKGSNKNPEIDVNATLAPEDRRVPVHNMLYVADGPSDIPVFSVVKRSGGKTYAVYNPPSKQEFAQNDELLQNGRIHSYGPANYTSESSTARWVEMHLRKMCDRIVQEHEAAVSRRVGKPPGHVHDDEERPAKQEIKTPEQTEFPVQQ